MRAKESGVGARPGSRGGFSLLGPLQIHRLALVFLLFLFSIFLSFPFLSLSLSFPPSTRYSFLNVNGRMNAVVRAIWTLNGKECNWVVFYLS